MRILFMGTPAFAVPSLWALHSSSHSVVGVLTQPDRPAGRNRGLKESVVKQWVNEQGLPLLQPERIKTPETIQTLNELAPDLIVVAAYGQILPPELLSLPRYGCLNVHASLLPRWRGAAPIQAALLHGDEKSGATIMLMDEGLDTGPILVQTSVPIMPEETAGSLSEKLAELGAGLLQSYLPDHFAGKLQPIPQDSSHATYAPQLRKSDGALDFTSSAQQLERQVRAYDPWPGSFFSVSGRHIAVLQATARYDSKVPPGKLTESNGSLVIGTSEGSLQIDRVHPSGKKAMSSKAFLAGNQPFLGQFAEPLVGSRN